MAGPKLNDGVLLAGDRPSTKATAKYLRGSASKAREVLDLIRGLDVLHADEVLQFTRRDVAAEIRKVLASAVANAVHNDEQDADELFVLACYADEGPTLRRFRPRARGRATRIRKRTCHVTVIVAQMSDERLEIVQARQQATTAAGRRRVTTSARARRDRVERSRTRAQSLREGGAAAPAEEAVADEETEAEATSRQPTSRQPRKPSPRPRSSKSPRRKPPRRKPPRRRSPRSRPPRKLRPNCPRVRWRRPTTDRSPTATRSRATPTR